MNHVLRVSAAGVRHAARLRHLPADELTRRIYAYHSLPLGRAPHCALNTWSEVADWIGLNGSSHWVRALGHAFISAADPDGHWMHWRRPASTTALLHKLYISPRPEAIPGMLPLLVETFDGLEVPAFKLGTSARGLLRPDKLVAYFANRDHLLAVADELTVAFKRVPVHGVPFTAPLDDTGLLSWGYDPGKAGGSWRLWIAQMLANGVIHAPQAAHEDTVRYARELLRSVGVDPDTWEPLGPVS